MVTQESRRSSQEIQEGSRACLDLRRLSVQMTDGIVRSATPRATAEADMCRGLTRLREEQGGDCRLAKRQGLSSTMSIWLLRFSTANCSPDVSGFS
jgi:hypothetical protein